MEWRDRSFSARLPEPHLYTAMANLFERLPSDVLERIADLLWFQMVVPEKRKRGRPNWAVANYLYKLAASDV